MYIIMQIMLLFLYCIGWNVYNCFLLVFSADFHGLTNLYHIYHYIREKADAETRKSKAEWEHMASGEEADLCRVHVQ